MADENKQEFFGMSYEDFAKLGPASIGTEEGASASSDVVDNADENGDNANAELPSSGSDTVAGGTTEEDPDADKGTDEGESEGDEAKSGDNAEDEPKAGEEQDKDKAAPALKDGGKVAVETPKEGQDKPVIDRVPEAKDLSQEQLAEFYTKVMTPFKANSRKVTLRSPEEAIRLMQMGAGAGRKVMELQPHLKTIEMLKKNNLLDENKLSYLIDLDKKNPEAIKKLIKDSGIDPLDLNMEDNADYKPTNHSVSDADFAFTEALRDVTSKEGGRETIQTFRQTWDQKSQDFLYAHPETLALIQSQRENGIYAQIAEEIEHQRDLGEIGPNVPFLEAYRLAGDKLAKANALVLKDAGTATTPQPVATATPAQGGNVQQPGRVLGTRTAAPKTAIANNEQAKAAGSPTASSRKAKETVNPLDMADDEFLKQFNGRI